MRIMLLEMALRVEKLCEKWVEGANKKIKGDFLVEDLENANNR